MTADDPIPGPDDPGFSVKAVFCKRLGKQLAIDQHVDCPYCCGAIDEVASAEHERFCEFDPAKDPIHFGFPGDTLRDREG